MAPLISSSTTAAIGTTAPCSTGLASTVLRLLGNKAGSIWFRAVPSVCVSLVAGKNGGTSDWITLRCPAAGLEGASVGASSGFGDFPFGEDAVEGAGGGSSGEAEDGRYTRIGMYLREEIGGRSLL